MSTQHERRIPDSKASFENATASERFTLFHRDVVALAKRLRTEALSGYRWNVPAKWENAHWIAQEKWLAKARDLIVQRAYAMKQETP